jgi:hypothetical protein
MTWLVDNSGIRNGFSRSKVRLCSLTLGKPHADSNSIACNVFYFVRQTDEVRCQEIYKQLLSRKPNKETEWIYNDYLVFSLVCAVKKFALPSEWVRQLLALRATQDEEKQRLNATLNNILAGNLNSREDYHQVSVVYQVITGEQAPDEPGSTRCLTSCGATLFPSLIRPFSTLFP